MRDLELAQLPRQRAGECPLLIPEQLQFEQRFRNRRTVDGDKRPVGAVAGGVQRACKQFLPGPALTLDQHGGIGSGRPLQGREDLGQPGVGTDNPRPPAPHRKLFPHQQVFGHEAAPLEPARDKKSQMVRIHGFREEIHGSFLHRADGVFDAAVGRHHDDRQIGIELLRRAEHAEAVTLREAEIRQNEPQLVIVQEPHGLWLIAGLDHRMPLTLQGMPKHLPERVLVFDEQNRGRSSRHGSPGQCSHPAGTPA